MCVCVFADTAFNSELEGKFSAHTDPFHSLICPDSLAGRIVFPPLFTAPTAP